MKKIKKALKKSDKETQKRAIEKLKEIRSVKDHLRENIAYDGSSVSEAESFNQDINYLRNQLGIELDDTGVTLWL